MQAMRVICARFNEERNWIEVVREMTTDDGTIEYNGLSLPIEKLEWLSAEYEIDDQDELVELAIYESLMPIDDRRQDAQAAKQQKRSRLVSAKQRLGQMRPTESKDALKGQLQNAGFPDTYINAIDDDAIEVIKRHSRMDPAAILTKRDHVKAIREGRPSSFNRPTTPSNRMNDSRNVRLENTVPVEVKLPKIELIGGKRVK